MKYLINIAIIIGKLTLKDIYHTKIALEKVDKEVLEKYTRKN